MVKKLPDTVVPWMATECCNSVTAAFLGPVHCNWILQQGAKTSPHLDLSTSCFWISASSICSCKLHLHNCKLVDHCKKFSTNGAWSKTVINSIKLWRYHAFQYANHSPWQEKAKTIQSYIILKTMLSKLPFEYIYRTGALLGACAHISTAKK